ncbi:MAG TPA: cation-translocating P-type ATPase [Armatimonadota bacterium]|jgi:Ca2+-transporting ATPase
MVTPQGLNGEGVAERRQRDGPNELPSPERHDLLQTVVQVLREPMLLMLLAGGALYMVLGDVAEGVMLLFFVFVVLGITLYQERKTERALEALRDLSSPRALVIREGVQQRIPARELVADDLILLSEGDRVPADAVILESTNLTVDESLLTGESVPVRKAAWDGAQGDSRPGGDDLPFVYSGTLVVKGQAVARVTSTGLRTEMGKIGRALQSLESEDTPLQRQTRRIVASFALVGLLLCVVVVVVFGWTRGDWLQGLLAGITLAMAILPEEFPMVLTIFLALGAWRIAHQRVLTRRVPAVETLGAATVLCVDKTGTLTQNRMRVSALAVGSETLQVDGGRSALPDQFHELVEFGLLASPSDPFDPMEKALWELGERCLADTEHIHRDWELLREYPLSEQLLAVSRVWRSRSHEGYVIAAKGAPEAIADLCHLDPERISELRRRIDDLADQGLRVIGVARARFRPADLPSRQHDFPFAFLGLLGLSDPIRPEVPEAVRQCYTAGIRVLMITGDYPGTATSIAQQIGLARPGQVLSGPELDAMDDATLRERVGATSVFARMVPEQKLRLVQALRAKGEVVAMTGDGVNDAPALKAAQIGVAMGGRGTDVARETADLVLLDDNFASIVQAVRLGRRIYDNLRKAMSFIVSVHVPIAGMSLLPVLLKWPLVLLPVHVVFLELIIDPACSTVFESQAEERGTMHRPPRPLDASLFDRGTLLRSLLQGLTSLALVLAVFVAVKTMSRSEAEARAASFITLVLADLGLIASNLAMAAPAFARSRQPNLALRWVSGASVLALVLTVSLPLGRRLFQFAPLHAADLGLALGAGVLALLLSEALKAPPVRRALAGPGDPPARRATTGDS